MDLNIGIDINTGILVLAFGYFFSGILGLVYRIHNKEDTIISIFLLSRVLELIAWILIGLRGEIPDSVSILLGNAVLIVGNSLEISAFLKIKDAYYPRIKRLHIWATVFVVVVVTVVAVWSPVVAIRRAVMSVLIISLWVPVLYILFAKGKTSLLQQFIAVLYAFAALPHLYSAFSIFHKTAGTDWILTPSHYSMMFLWIYLAMLVGNMGLILMAKEKSDYSMLKAATYDELTDILNRRTFLEKAEEVLVLYIKRKKPISFFLMDIDDFKQINDFHGHFIGDMVLKDFAYTIKEQLREEDLFGRVGGEEFTILLPETTEKQAFEVAERLRHMVEQSCVNQMIHYTVSIGTVTVVPDESTTIDMLYKLSDKAMYRAKRNGKNRIERAKSLRMPPHKKC